MKSNRCVWMMALLVAPWGLQAQSPATSVTLFNSGRVLVRRTLPIAITAGQSVVNVPIGVFTPSTFASLEPGVRVMGVRSQDMVSEDGLLRRNIGRAFDIESNNVTHRYTLLALDPERWREHNGHVVFGRPGVIHWTADQVPTTVTADVTIVSDRARQGMRALYETQGSSWSASYQLFLGVNGHIDGTASIVSGMLDLADAEVQLLAGNIGQGNPPAPKAAPMMMAAETRSTAAYFDGVPTTESIGETHLYTLPGRWSFIPGSTMTVPLFDPAPVRAERRYVLPGVLPLYGGIGEVQDRQGVPVAVMYRVDRKLGSPFGEVAMPAGYVAVFDTDRGGRVQLIGQGNIGHTAPGNELLVDAGTAFDVTADRVQMDYSTTRMPATPTTPGRTVAMSSYRVTLRNARDSAVAVEVREDHVGEWSVVESSLPPVRRSSTRTIFNVSVAPRDSSVVTYRVRVVW